MNRLARELAGLRMRQQQQTPQPQSNGTSRDDVSGTANGSSGHSAPVLRFEGMYPDPSPSIILDALKKENESLRSKLADMEREHGHLKRINEVYREELIEHRTRVRYVSPRRTTLLLTGALIYLQLNLSVDHLIGLSSGTERDPLPQSTHLRRPSTTTQQTCSMVSIPNGRPIPSMPIPRAGSQVSQPRRTHEPGPSISSLANTSPSTSSSPSPRISPLNTGAAASYVTTMTSPPSSASLHASPPAPYDYTGAMPAGRVLSYPSVPPPSLSSSLGSPVVSTHMFRDDGDGRVGGSASRRSSGHSWGYGSAGGGNSVPPSATAERRVVETGNLRDIARPGTRSIERGGRVAETGTLVRSRAGSGSSATGVPD